MARDAENLCLVFLLHVRPALCLGESTESFQPSACLLLQSQDLGKWWEVGDFICDFVPKVDMGVPWASSPCICFLRASVTYIVPCAFCDGLFRFVWRHCLEYHLILWGFDYTRWIHFRERRGTDPAGESCHFSLGTGHLAWRKYHFLPLISVSWNGYIEFSWHSPSPLVYTAISNQQHRPSGKYGSSQWPLPSLLWLPFQWRILFLLQDQDTSLKASSKTPESECTPFFGILKEFYSFPIRDDGFSPGTQKGLTFLVI